MKIPQPKISDIGIAYYQQLPQGFRVATTRDYEKGFFKHNTPYLVHGYHSGLYHPKRVNHSLHPDLLPFLKDGRIYVLKEKP